MVHFIQTGTVFTVLKQNKWAVHGQPTPPTSALLVEPNSVAILGLIHTNIQFNA